MAKLGYTWYPKDWGSSESVFELNLSERGLYRELIDLAMLNDNKTELKLDVWSRKFAIDVEGLTVILGKLTSLGLIKIKAELLFIPSCESRLKLARGGSNGGKKSKPPIKPNEKPLGSLEEKNEKPTPNQIEIEKESKKEKESKEPPSEKEFLDYCKTITEFKFENFEFSLKAKREAWINNGWKDGNGEKIKNWKTKIKNTYPYLVPVYPTNQEPTKKKNQPA